MRYGSISGIIDAKMLTQAGEYLYSACILKDVLKKDLKGNEYTNKIEYLMIIDLYSKTKLDVSLAFPFDTESDSFRTMSNEPNNIPADSKDALAYCIRKVEEKSVFKLVDAGAKIRCCGYFTDRCMDILVHEEVMKYPIFSVTSIEKEG